MRQRDYDAWHGPCAHRRLDSAMNTTYNRLTQDEERELDAQVEMCDWARTAGVSADDLRQALRSELSVVELEAA